MNDNKPTLILVEAALESNGKGFAAWAMNLPGAYARAESREDALGKLEAESVRVARWAYGGLSHATAQARVLQEHLTELQVQDADTDILFANEKQPLALGDFARLRAWVVNSAHDLRVLADSLPSRAETNLPERETFYGLRPRTCDEVLHHANGVTAYYLGELGIDHTNLPDVYDNRLSAMQSVSARLELLQNVVMQGSGGEFWTLRKVLRRFLWHDRIHARALWRMGVSMWGSDAIADPFGFG
ncbi:MAG TPA: hypothetical protein PKD55_07135 [Bellilinea sp.]|nr:hypothetical protein [Bellilinea sp.]